MNSEEAVEFHVEGSIGHLELAGRGAASGQLLIVVNTDTGGQTTIIGSIVAGTAQPNTLEHGVFTGFATMAAFAFLQKVRVRVSYRTFVEAPPVNRITGLRYLP